MVGQSLDPIYVEDMGEDSVLQFSTFLNSTGGQPYYKMVFGQFNFSNLMENSAVIMKATTKLMSGVKVGGMVCVSNTSTLPDGSNPAGSVAELMAAELRLKIAGVTVMNTMLLNLLALENSSEAENSFGTELMREAFSRLTDMDILLFICPAKARIHEFISSTFTLDKSEFSVEGLVDKKIYKLRREDVLPRLRVRRAGVEDNDDLLPIVRAKNREEGVEESNDFFLANLIQNQNEVNHVFVGLDKNDTPVGILCTTREVDITSLSKVYDLSRLPGLKSMGVLPKAEVTKQKPILILIVGEISMIGTELLREGALSLGFLYFSGQEVQDGTQSLESSSNFEESVNAFFYRIEKLLHPLSGPKPRGCVIGGFPTNASQAAGLKKSALSVTFVVELTCTEAESHLADADQIEAIKLMQKVGPIDSLQGAIWVDFVFKASDEKTAVSKRLIEELAKVVQLQKPKIPAEAAKSAIEKVSVFASTLFCLDKRNQSRVNDLILAAFEEHPTYDYFFLMQPINVITSGSVTSTMFPVPIRRGVTTTQSLFAIHREYFTMYSQFTVSVYTPEMSLPLEVFLLSLGSSAPSVSQLLGTTPSQTVPVNVCYVALVQNRVVGFLSFVRRAIASEEFTAFRRDFEIDRVVDLNRHRTRAQTFIHRWYTSPIFEGRGSYFLSEAMRQSSKSLVYLSDDMIKDTADFVIQKLYPVRPRLWGKHDKSFIITPATNLFTASSALYFASKRMLFKCRKVVESRVVVVGNSAAAFAHLAKHIYNHAIYFTNISVVVDTIFYGLQIPSTAPIENHVYQKSFEGHFAPVNHEYLSSEEFVRQGFYRRLKIFEGTLTDIDRISQAIVISDGQIIDYDFLVLSVSTQDITHHKLPVLKKVHPLSFALKGVFNLGSVAIDELAIKWVKGETSGAKEAASSNNVVVYGSGMYAMSAMSKLLEAGVGAASIIWVHKGPIDLGNQEGIDEAIEESIVSTEVVEWNRFCLVDVLFDARSYVKGVKVLHADNSNGVPLVINCCAVLLADKFLCPVEVFSAINEAGIVFDGALVIDADFRTNDPHVYGVGDFTRYSRKFRNTQDLSKCSQVEMGELAADRLLAHILHGKEGVVSATTTPRQEFSRPRTMSGGVPGGKFFLRSSIPYAGADTTYFCTKDDATQNVCALRINHLGLLCEFLYIGTDKSIDGRKISRLVGKYEGFLNSAVESYEAGEALDWIAFFNQPWADFLCYDAFDTLEKELRHRFEGSAAIGPLLGNVLNNALCTPYDIVVVGDRRKFLGKKAQLLESSTKQMIESTVADFIRDHKDFLPRYLVPKPSKGD